MAKLALFVAVALHMVGFGAVIPVMPTLVKSLGGDAVVQGLLTSVFTLAQLVSAPLWGWASDRLGRRVIIAAGLGLAALGNAGLYLAKDLAAAFVARALAGLGGGTLPAIQAAVLELSRPEERATSMALFGMAFGVGFVLGPLIGGILAVLSPRGPFLAAALLSATAALWTAAVYKPPATPLQLKAGGGGGGVVVLVAAAFFLMNMAFSQFEAIVSYYGSDLGLTPAYIGLMMALAGVAAGGAQWAVRRLERGGSTVKGISVGLAAMAGGLLTVAVPAVPALFVGVAVASAGQIMASAFISKAVAEGAERVGLAFGVMQTAGSLGRLVGPAAGGYLYKALSPSAPFLAAAALAVLTLALFAYGIRNSPVGTRLGGPLHVLQEAHRH